MKSERILKKSTKQQGFQSKYCKYCKYYEFGTDLNWQIWDELTFSPESDNDAGGEKLETVEKMTKLMDLSLEYWRFITEIHRFHNVQSEIHQNTDEIQRFKWISKYNIASKLRKYRIRDVNVNGLNHTNQTICRISTIPTHKSNNGLL